MYYKIQFTTNPHIKKKSSENKNKKFNLVKQSVIKGLKKTKLCSCLQAKHGMYNAATKKSSQLVTQSNTKAPNKLCTIFYIFNTFEYFKDCLPKISWVQNQLY